MRLEIEHDKCGLWFVTSPDVKGLLVSDPTFAGALNLVPEALEALALARKLHTEEKQNAEAQTSAAKIPSASTGP